MDLDAVEDAFNTKEVVAAAVGQIACIRGGALSRGMPR